MSELLLYLSSALFIVAAIYVGIKAWKSSQVRTEDSASQELPDLAEYASRRYQRKYGRKPTLFQGINFKE